MRYRVNKLISTYNSLVNVFGAHATKKGSASYMRTVDFVKSNYQKYITEEIVKIAWKNLKGDESRLKINSQKFHIPIREEYIHSIPEVDVRRYVLQNVSDYYYGISVDKQVFIDDTFVLGIECKAFAENAMLKRILVDFSLLKIQFPHLSCYLFQLESQLGGDYSELNTVTFGSTSTLTLMSYFPNVELKIFTLLKGERKVDQPIHKSQYFKPLQYGRISKAVKLIEDDLRRFL